MCEYLANVLSWNTILHILEHYCSPSIQSPLEYMRYILDGILHLLVFVLRLGDPIVGPRSCECSYERQLEVHPRGGLLRRAYHAQNPRAAKGQEPQEAEYVEI